MTTKVGRWMDTPVPFTRGHLVLYYALFLASVLRGVQILAEWAS